MTGFERKPGGSSLLDDWLAPVTGSAGKQTLTQQLGVAPAPVDPRIAATRDKLVARDVKEARLGDLSSVAAIESSLPRAFELLDWIKQGGGRRGSHNRIISAWNAGQDGLDNRARWPTILHYVLYLDHMARESMGVGLRQGARRDGRGPARRHRGRRQDPGASARVLGVMAESAAGRGILTAPEPRPADLAAFHDALGRVAGASEAAALIEGVRERVIEPYEDGPPELAALRDRGYFLADDGQAR